MAFGSSNQVDSKVVELQFNNQQFEANAKTSLSTLERLKKALDFSKTKTSIMEMGDGLKSITISSLASGLDQVQAKFSSLDVVAMTTISRITNGVIDMGEAFVKSVSTDQIEAGWNKYAEKTSAVQTIMAATAKEWGGDTAGQMEHVNSQLEKLNWFTDETSYSFLDMVNNIGKFTSNSIPLERSVTAMEGISTWAAVSGANIGEAGRAMYNLSQAIAVGSVKLMDWKSIENANMATAEFKETAIQTALELKTLTEAGEGVYKTIKGNEVSVTNFNQSLSDGWFTSEVLLSTLDRYGAFTDKLNEAMNAVSENVTASQMLDYIDDYKNGELDLAEATRETGLTATALKGYLQDLSSTEMAFGMKAFKAAQEAKTFQEAVDSVKDAVSTGWMNTFELMFGDYMKAKTLWTDLANDLYDIFAEGGNERNALIEEAFNQQEAVNLQDWEQLQNSGIVSKEFIAALAEAVRKNHGYTKSFADDATWLRNVLENGRVTADDLSDSYAILFGGGKIVDEGMKSAVESIKDSDEEFRTLFETLSGYTGEDVSKIIFGDHSYSEGERELESTLDQLMKKMGYAQEDGYKFVDVLKEMGLFGGQSAEYISDLSDEELRLRGYTDESINELHKLKEEGKDTNEAIQQILERKPTTEELWTDTLHLGMESLVDIFEVASDAWAEVFPSASADMVTDIITKIHDAVAGFKEWVTESDTLHNLFEGVFSILSVIITAAKDFGSGVLSIVSAVLEGLGINIEDLANNVAGASVSFKDWFNSAHPIAVIMQGIARVAGIAASAVKGLVDWFLKIPFVQVTLNNFKVGFKSAFESLPEFFSGFSGKFDEFLERVDELGGFSFSNIANVFKAFKETILDYIADFEGFKSLKSAFSALKSDIISVFGEMVSGVWDKLTNLRESLDGTFAGTALGGIMDGLEGIYNSVKELFLGGKSLPDIAREGLSIGLDAIKKAFMNFFEVLKFGFTKINWLELGKYAGIFMAIKKVFTFITSIREGIHAFLHPVQTIGTIFDTFSDTMSAVKKRIQVDLVKSIAVAIGILVGCVFLLAQLSIPDLVKGVVVVGLLGGLIVALMFAISRINKGDKGGAIKGGGFLLAFAAAIRLLVGAVRSLGELDPTVLENGLVAVGVLAAILTGVAYILKNVKIGIGTGAAIAVIAFAVKILAGLVKPLGEMDPDVLERGLIGVGLLAAIIAAVGYALNKTKVKASAGVALLFIAFAIKVLAGLVKTLGELEPQALENGLVAVGLLGGILAAMAWAVGKTKIGPLKALGTIGLAYAIKALSSSVKPLGELDPEALENGVVAVGFLGAILAAMAWAVGKTKIGPLKALGTVGLAYSIRALSESVKPLGELDPEALENGVIAIGFLGAILAGMAWAVGKTKIGVLKSISTMGLAAAADIIASAASKLAVLDPDGLNNAVVAVGLLGAILAAMAWAVGKTDIGFLKTLNTLGLAAAIGILAGIVEDLSKIEPDGLQNAEIALGVMSACLAIVAYIIGKSKKLGVKSALNVLAISAALWIISGAMLELSKIPANKLKGTVIALAAATLAIVAIGLVFGNLKSMGLGKIMSIIAIAGALWIAMQGIAKLATCDTESLNAASIALGVLGAVIAGLMIVSNFCSGGSILKLFGVVAAVGVLALILGLLSNLTEPTSLLTTAASLSMLSVAIGVLLGILALVGLAGPAVWNGLAALGVLVGAFLILGVIFGAIEKLTGGGFSDFVGKGMDVLVKVAEGIGRFFGAIIAGISIEAIKALPEIADALVSFMTKLQGLDNVGHINWGAFLEALGAVTGVSFTELLTAIPNIVTEFATGKPAMAQFSEDLGYLSTALVDWQDKMSGVGKIVIDNKGISSLCHAIAEIALLGIGDAISSFITSFAFGEGVTPVKQFSNDLGVLSTALSDWQEKMSGIGTLIVDTKGISDLVKAIGDIAVLEIGDAISSLITSFAFGEGVSAVEQFSNNLGVLSTGLSDWQEKMNTIGTIKIPSDKIDELSENIKKIEWDSFKGALADGITKMLTGEDTLHRFKTKTNTLARALSEWQTKMEEIGSVSVPSAEITELAKAIETIPDTGIFGAIASFLGFQSDVESFASEIGALGTGLKEFSDNVGPNYNGESLITAIDTLTAIATNATDIASFSEWMNSNLGLFGGNLGKLALDINDFVDKVAKDEENYDKVGGLVAKILNSLGLIAIATISDETGSLSDTTAVDTLIQNITNLVDLIGEKLGGFDGSGVEAFTSAVKSLSEADISGAVDKMYASNGGKESKAMSESGSAMGASLATSMGDQTGAMKDAMGSLTGAATEALSGASDAFGTKGTELIGAMAAAVAEATSFSDALVAMVREAANGLDTNALYNSGVYFVKGFAQGIIDNTAEAAGRAAAMARAAMLAVQSTIKQGSPSREMMKSGMWFALGFSQGIGDYAYTAFDAAAEMGAGTMDSMRKAVGSVKDILTADLSGDPVIRPVLDLSEIESGASTIGGLFGNMQPISLMSDLDIIQTNSQAMKRRASTDDLLTALGSLAVTGDTYNYNVGGVSYDDGTNIAAAVRTLAHAVRAGGRA